MIHIQINPARVVKVLFRADSTMEEDFNFATWQTIRLFINQINQHLTNIAEEITRERTAERIHQEDASCGD